jgi:ribose transport system permease protein
MSKESYVKPNLLARLVRNNQSGIFIAAVALFLGFSVFTNSFLSSYNLFNISRNIAFYILIGLGQAIVMAIGGMNVSFGAIGGLATTIVGVLITKAGMPNGIAALGAAGVGIACGLFNGFFITRFRINDFIVTLATSFIFTGINYGISRGFPYTNMPGSITFIGRGRLLGLPLMFWLVIAVLVLASYFFAFTVTGRYILATGSNLNAARLSGIKVQKMRVVSHALSGLLAALTGFLYVSRMGSAQPATGQDWLIISFSVAVIGGTSLNGGVISALGLFLGAVIIVLIQNGLVLVNANVYFEQAFIGTIILVVVTLDGLRMRKSSIY